MLRKNAAIVVSSNQELMKLHVVDANCSKVQLHQKEIANHGSKKTHNLI
jgi:hypothetical protein